MKSPWRAQVYLVGAGPGDPGLLTRRGEACLRRADIILYDNLTNPELLKLAAPNAEKVYVGKKAREPRPDQASINTRLIDEARRGKIVVRLKGGDSFVFGRGGEEAQALFEAGIRFEVVPGITSAIAVPSAAGIPVTHRGLNTLLHIMVGYEDPDDPGLLGPLDLLGRPGSTIVILMGTAHIDKILRRLREAGLPPETPLATIQSGTYPRQRSIRMTLADALADPERAYLPPPSITVLGAVAGLDEGLNWFERRPLFGRRVILARSEESSEEIAATLAEAGADVRSIPLVRFEQIEIAPPGVGAHLEQLRTDQGWLILPSPTAIRFFFERLEAEGLDARALHGIRLAVIGDRSAEELKRRGVSADFVPVASSAESLGETLPISDARAALIAGSSLSRPELPEILRRRGLEVGDLALYAPSRDDEGVEAVRGALEQGEADSIILFSPSAVHALGEAPKDFPRTVRWIAIGTTTARAMQSAGLPLFATAPEPTAEGLIQALFGTE